MVVKIILFTTTSVERICWRNGEGNRRKINNRIIMLSHCHVIGEEGRLVKLMKMNGQAQNWTKKIWNIGKYTDPVNITNDSYTVQEMKVICYLKWHYNGFLQNVRGVSYRRSFLYVGLIVNHLFLTLFIVYASLIHLFTFIRPFVGHLFQT